MLGMAINLALVQDVQPAQAGRLEFRDVTKLDWNTRFMTWLGLMAGSDRLWSSQLPRLGCPTISKLLLLLLLFLLACFVLMTIMA